MFGRKLTRSDGTPMRLERIRPHSPLHHPIPQIMHTRHGRTRIARIPLSTITSPEQLAERGSAGPNSTFQILLIRLLRP